MEGRGAWHDNVFVERLWRSVKYEEVYRRAYDIVSDAAPRSADTSTFTMAGLLTRALTAAPQIKLTSTRCRSARQLNLGGSSTYRRGIAVQTTGTISGQVERMNRTIKDATVKRFHYETHAELRSHLSDFVNAYNFAKRLKTLKGLTPYEFICKAWTKEQERFTLNLLQQMPGLNI